MNDRYRITIVGDNIDLRGYIDGIMNVHVFADLLRDIHLTVVASPADDNYNPHGHQSP